MSVSQSTIIIHLIHNIFKGSLLLSFSLKTSSTFNKNIISSDEMVMDEMMVDEMMR